MHFIGDIVQLCIQEVHDVQKYNSKQLGKCRRNQTDPEHSTGGTARKCCSILLYPSLRASSLLYSDSAGRP